MTMCSRDRARERERERALNIVGLVVNNICTAQRDKPT